MSNYKAHIPLSPTQMAWLCFHLTKVFDLKITALTLNTKYKIFIAETDNVDRSSDIRAAYCFIKVKDCTSIIRSLNDIDRNTRICCLLAAKFVWLCIYQNRTLQCTSAGGNVPTHSFVAEHKLAFGITNDSINGLIER